MRRKLETAVLAVMLLFLTSMAQPCECGWYQNVDGKVVALDGPPTIDKEGLSRYEVVFEGQVIRLDLVEIPLEDPQRDETFTYDVDVRFRVLKTWKGAPSAQPIVHTSWLNISCGYPFLLGESYLVYVENASNFRVDLCSRTQVQGEAGADLDALAQIARDEAVDDNSDNGSVEGR